MISTPLNQLKQYIRFKYMGLDSLFPKICQDSAFLSKNYLFISLYLFHNTFSSFVIFFLFSLHLLLIFPKMVLSLLFFYLKARLLMTWIYFLLPAKSYLHYLNCDPNISFFNTICVSLLMSFHSVLDIHLSSFLDSVLWIKFVCDLFYKIDRISASQCKSNFIPFFGISRSYLNSYRSSAIDIADYG